MTEKTTLKEILAEPQNLDGLDIPHNILIDIILRLLYSEGNVTFRRISQVTRVPGLLQQTLEWMRQERLVEVSQSGSNFGPLSAVYRLSATGEERARGALNRSQYIGPVPVPINDYNRAIELQTSGPRHISVSQVKEALADLVLPEEFHRRVGPAINSAASLLLYGPSGNGKTTIAMRLAQLIGGTDPIWLPYALTAGGQIIQVHDRLFHKPVSITDENQIGQDKRWGLFERPTVTIGGELKLEALELRFDPVAKIYEAPLQLKANGGLFLIDDFGRQQASPAELLNRWIVPLENGVDYLRLPTGQMIVVPFRELLIFSTNLDPFTLADEAFYRRIQMKVGIFSPDEQRFRQIFQTVCSQTGLPFDEISFQHLLGAWYRPSGRSLQAVHPRDLLKIVDALCCYANCPPQLNPTLIDEACEIYFVRKE
jgi:predicted ATPase with chaperone activity